MAEEKPCLDKVNTYERSNIKGYEMLEALALDLIWSWNHSADKVWKHLDPALWEITRNPWVILQTVSRERLENALADPNFCKITTELLQINKKEAQKNRWFQEKYSKEPIKHIAYFSMEYMLSEALPIYSGGLGNVAGDQLKAASDLGLPTVAIGLLYQQGYFRQIIDKDGYQQALYPFNDPGQLPITPLRKPNGEWLRIEIPLPGWPLWLRAWHVKVGRVHLFLLDTNDAANYPVLRGVTSELYGGNLETRFKQEMVLGIGGWRLLEALGIKPEVCHLNEGHAAFVVAERALNFMIDTGVNFETALATTRAGNLFTTHTAVTAGFDRFPPDLVKQYLDYYIEKRLGISLHDFLALGRENPNDPSEPFNMAYLAMRGSGYVNGVSQLHGKVSRELFNPIFNRWDADEVPVGYVTNGIHVPSWDSIAADKFWEDTCGDQRWFWPTEELDEHIREASDAKIWQMRNDSRKALIEFTRSRLARQLAARGAAHEDVERAQRIFDPNILTLGFARRFATYKRPNMLLSNPERLLRILTNSERPVQLIIAGKAHPADKEGQEMIHQWINFIRHHHYACNVIFMADYDMLLTEQLVQGVDVWVNTPRRPWEACGTSGMKILVNGGLNLSELDGWWAEAYCPEVGWALGDGKEHGPENDAVEAARLYDIIEHEIAPEFYNRDKAGIPQSWIKRIKESMARLTPKYSANRTVRQYTEQYYLPAAKNYKFRAADKGAMGAKIVAWRKNLSKSWPGMRLSDTKVETKQNQHHFECKVYLNGLEPDNVNVEIFANGPKTFSMEVVEQISQETFLYRGVAPANQPQADYTLRVVPYFPGVEIPLEANYVLWQR